MGLRSTVFGSVSISWVMVPAAMKGSGPAESGPSLSVAVWLGNGILVSAGRWIGVMSTAGIVG